MEDGSLIRTAKKKKKFVGNVVLVLSNPQSLFVMLPLRDDSKPKESFLWCYPLSGTCSEPGVIYRGGFGHKIAGWKGP